MCEAPGTTVARPKGLAEIVRSKRQLLAQCGWGARLSGMVNTCELLINVVIHDKPNRADRLDQKVRG